MLNLIPLFGLALGCSLLGLMQLLRRTPAKFSILALALIGSGVADLLLFRYDLTHTLPSLALTAVVAVSWMMRSVRLRAVLGNPVFQGLVLLPAGPGLLLAVATLSKEVPEFQSDGRPVMQVSVALTCPESAFPLTDKGRPVPLYSALNGSPDALNEPKFIRHWAEKASVIRTTEADPSYNCHGWVFTGDKGWLSAQGVESILRDNEYHEVDGPRVNDLIVYHEGGEIVHSGVVRVAEPNGLVLVESKWGWEGRFVHAPENQPYGNEFHYYHSDRSGHHLRTSQPESDHPHPKELSREKVLPPVSGVGS